MYKIIKLATVVSAIVLVSACAITPNHHIDIAAREHINEVDAYLAVTQDEIYADINRSNTAAVAGGGILFSIIDTAVDNSRTKSAEELIKPIRDSLIDFDFAKILQKDIEEKLKSIEWMGIKNVELEHSIDDGHLLKKIEKSDVSAVLFMKADYKITPNFDGVATSVSLVMFPNKEALYEYKEKLDNNENPVDQSDNIYRNNILVNIELELTGDKKENSLQLADSKARKVREALEESSNKIAQSIFDDILLDGKI